MTVYLEGRFQHLQALVLGMSAVGILKRALLGISRHLVFRV